MSFIHIIVKTVLLVVINTITVQQWQLYVRTQCKQSG